tara:strand:+ start:1634 stop:2968 length:1335 start_codon:yes stop_codon:yes gene_type:complete
MGYKFLLVKNKVRKFKKILKVDGDKSISIRWLLLASQAIGVSKAKNLLRSEDVLSAIECLKKLGIKIKLSQQKCIIYGRGINGFKFKKNLILNAGNSGTVGRLILPLLIKSPFKIKIIGDKSLSRRDFSRVIDPLNKIGVKFFPKGKKRLPISILGSNYLRPIDYFEKRGSAQCKTSVMLASLNTPGEMRIFAQRSRNHTELMFKNLKMPITVKKKGEIDFIKTSRPDKLSSFNLDIPGDISSSAFFIALTLLSKNSYLVLKNINLNTSRLGIIKILNKMGAGIKTKNIKLNKGEKCGDIIVKSNKKLKAINCPSNLNSSAIDEFLIIFLIAARSKGISYFKNLSELNKKESPRLKLGSKILNMIGIKTKLTNNSIKIYGNPNINLNKNYEIKNYLKDHRIMAMCTIAALTLGGEWKIYDPESINTSFPSFIKILKTSFGVKFK